MMDIRRLTITDYPDMMNLWSRADLPFKPKGRDSKAAISKEMKAHPTFFLGAFENGHLIGTAIVSCDLRKGWINRLTVDVSHRNRGVAKALIDQSEKVLRDIGIHIFCALIETSNIASQQLFEKKGYVQADNIVYFSKRDSDDV
jgi:ribosomal protein S18 acetylase RimI-like enzyme